jgi:hypothetical protein
VLSVLDISSIYSVFIYKRDGTFLELDGAQSPTIYIHCKTFFAFMMKLLLSSLLLIVSGANCGVLQERNPQVSADGTLKLGNGLGPFGIDLTFLQGFDGARLGPFLANIQPYFRSAVKSGVIPRVLSAVVPTIPLKTKKEDKPQVRESAKRQISRLGPLNLVAKGVSTNLSILLLEF